MKYQPIILDFISAQSDGVQEYALMCFLQKDHPVFFSSLGDGISLYKKHFFLFNYLYKINERLASEQMQLVIEPLSIRLLETNVSDAKNGTPKNSSKDSSISSYDALKSFYLDDANLLLSDEEVLQMQRKFWEKFLALNEKAAAIETLGLQNIRQLNLPRIKKRFNQLAQKHHPDKGGDPVYYTKLLDAYKILKVCA